MYDDIFGNSAAVAFTGAKEHDEIAREEKEEGDGSSKWPFPLDRENTRERSEKPNANTNESHGEE